MLRRQSGNFREKKSLNFLVLRIYYLALFLPVDSPNHEMVCGSAFGKVVLLYRESSLQAEDAPRYVVPGVELRGFDVHLLKSNKLL